MGILGLLMLGVASFVAISFQQLKGLAINQAGMELRLQFISTLQNRASWDATVNDSVNLSSGGSFRCFTDNSCGSNGGGGFRVLQSSAPTVTFYDSAATSGFTQGGVPCSGFDPDAAVGNDACPFHVSLSWIPICVDNCDPKFIKVSGVIVFNPKTKPQSPLNGKYLEFTLAKEVSLKPPVICITSGMAGTVVQTPNGFNHGKCVFSYFGDYQSILVQRPTPVSVKLWGAGGGGGAVAWQNGGNGGGGGFVSGSLLLQPGTYQVLVGQGGANQTAINFGGGGINGCGQFAPWNAAYTGGGGGRSAILSAGSDLVTAGAGGGGGMSDQTDPGHGGAGGGLVGETPVCPVSYYKNWTTGEGGTQTRGGHKGPAASVTGSDGGLGVGGSYQQSVTSSPSIHCGGGGGGGGGYYGGGGGSDTCGGGGGSSFIGNLNSGVTTPGSATDPGNGSDSDYVAGVGVGGLGQQGSGCGGGCVSITAPWQSGGNGLVVITW